jgi:hypothetical protein
LYQVSWSSNQEDEMGGECGKYGDGGEERCVQAFGGETWTKETNWGVDWRIILKWILKK